jgi:large conductance mechanosensitive channel
MPPIGILIGGVDFSELKLTVKDAAVDAAGAAIPAVTINYGMFINNIINFLIVAFAIFMMIKAMNMAKKKEAAAPAVPPAPPAPSAQEKLLMEIRDILSKK